MNEKMSDKLTAGPTGEFPQGKAAADDKGGLAIRFAIVDDNIVIDFGCNVNWVAMDRDRAIDFGNRLIALAESE